MKLKSKILISLTVVGVLSSAAFTFILVNHFKNYNGSNNRLIIYDPSAVTRELKNEEAEIKPKDESNENLPTPLPKSDSISEKVTEPIETIPEPKKEEENYKPSTPVNSRPKEWEDSADADLDEVLNPDYDADLNIRTEEIKDLDSIIDTNPQAPGDEDVQGGRGTYIRKQGRIIENHSNYYEFLPGGQSSSIALTKLVNSSPTFKKLKPGTKIKSKDFKDVKENSLIYTGEEFIELDDEILKDALLTIQADPSPWHKKHLDLQNYQLTEEDKKMLRKGFFPVSASVWALRPGFLNTTFYKMTKNNLNRYIPLKENAQRSPERIRDLDWTTKEFHKTGTGWQKTIVDIPGFSNNVAVLNVYTDEKGDQRYIVEVKLINQIQDINQLLDAAKSIMSNKTIGTGLALRNVQSDTQEKAVEFVQKMNDSVKALTLFYEYNDPKVINAIIDNPNFSARNKLYELNVITNDTHLENSDKTIVTVDPRVFLKVKPGAYDHYASAIYTIYQLKDDISKTTMSKLLEYIYVKEKDRREFQGRFGEGGHNTKWDLSNTEIYDLNNIIFPRINNKELKFTKVIFPVPENRNLKIDLSKVINSNDDNTTGKIYFGMGQEPQPVEYGHDPSQWPDTLTLTATSPRGVSADLQSIYNILFYSNSINKIDLSNTEITESEAKSQSWSSLGRGSITITLKNGQIINV
ncbi:hypothetical protein NV226_02925 [Mycoplasma iguanae]|uniref:Transmembrane protein n=1 Tax=Mycoplasma iguanae TaxID=292461 RepID=A0ABY5RA64_9MOLU|nr:hypothetical protein [Mycoplasma iguanae]UVD81652.1 hypothetical protein NV226_02925 [Mycoplasma iguanae]